MTIKPLILNKYLPVKELGTGGFATVILAKDMLVKRMVAIKCIELTELDSLRAQWVQEDLAREAAVEAINNLNSGKTTISLTSNEGEDELAGSLEQRYLDELPGLGEAQALCMLSDPTIVTVYDCQISGNTVYLIEEYVEGPTLGKLLEEHNEEVTLDVVAAVAQSVAHALEVAHDRGILHFDIKPDNVLIDAEGNVKVTDFGLATLSDAQGQGTADAGTIGYMPLEQMRGEALDARADEWALASIVYEMLVGENPFMAPTLEAAEKIAAGADLTLPSRCWDELPETIDDVIFDALHPDREERYDTVAEFAEDLLPCLGDPERGHHDLQALVAGEPLDDDWDEDADDDDSDDSGPEDSEDDEERLHLYERVSPRMAALGAHVLGAAASGFLGALGAMNIAPASGFDNPIFWVVTAFCALLGGIRPVAGALAGYAALVVALFFNQSIVLGLLLAVVVAAWVALVVDDGNAVANTALLFPLLGSVGFAPLAVMMTGYCARLPKALLTTALGGLVCIVLAGAGSLDVTNWWAPDHFWFDNVSASFEYRVTQLIQLPATWIVCASWLVASMALSLAGKARKRAISIVGVAIAVAVLGAATAYVAPTVEHGIILAASAVVMLLAISFPSPRVVRRRNQNS